MMVSLKGVRESSVQILRKRGFLTLTGLQGVGQAWPGLRLHAKEHGGPRCDYKGSGGGREAAGGPVT